MDYKTELIKQLEELEADNTQHPSFYDGYGFAISDAIETIKKFNYIPCCESDSELLKVLEYTRQVKNNPKEIQLLVDKLYIENL